jgi:hypothetical protein
MLEMDYNTPSTVELLQHASWNDVEHSRLILETILKSLPDTETEKIPIWHTFLESLLLLEDDIKTMRLQIVMSPFTAPGQPHSFITVLQDIRTKHPHNVYVHVRFLLHLNERIPEVYSMLFRSRKEISWLEPFIEAKLSARVGPRIIAALAKEAAAAAAEPEPKSA